MGTGKKWSKEEIEQLKRLHSENKNFAEIGRELGRGKSSVKLKLNSLGFKANKSAYIYEVGEIVNKTVRIVEQIRVKNGNKTCKGYMVQSLPYPNTEPYEKSEYNLMSGKGCSYFTKQRICPENSLYSVERIRPNLIDVSQSKTISPHYSKEKMLFKCENEDCNHTKKMTPSHLVRAGFACDICSKGYYPELLFMSYSEEKNAGFIPQQRFKDFPNHIFDFVNYERRIIVETHGLAHYEECTGYMSHKKTVESDKRKRKYCKENNWTLIELDCRESSFEFIRNSIANEPLLEDIIDDEVYNILEIIELNRHYPVKEIKEMYMIGRRTTYEIAEYFKVSPGVINRILDKANTPRRTPGESMSKPTKCLNNGIVYTSTKNASEQLGLDRNCVKNALNPNNKSKSVKGYTFEYLAGAELKAYYHAEYRRTNPTLEIELDDSI